MTAAAVPGLALSTRIDPAHLGPVAAVAFGTGADGQPVLASAGRR